MHQVLPGNSKQQSMTQTHRLQNLILPRFWKIERAYPHPIRKASKLGLTITKRCFCHGVHDLRFQQQTLFSLRQQDALFRDLTCPFLETALNEKYKSPTTKTYNSFYKTIHWCQKIHSKKWKKNMIFGSFSSMRCFGHLGFAVCIVPHRKPSFNIKMFKSGLRLQDIYILVWNYPSYHTLLNYFSTSEFLKLLQSYCVCLFCCIIFANFC